MDAMTLRRAGMSGLGALAGAAGYGLMQMAEADVLGTLPLMLAWAFAASFFTALMGMEGPLGPNRAGLGAGAIALAVTGLLWLVSLRFAQPDQVFNTPMATLACIVVALVPMPFWIAQNDRGLRDYPTLFGESWGIVVRYMVALVFVGTVWLVILLSDSLLQLVGLRLLDDVISQGVVPWVLTGAALGLGLAVSQDLSDYISPFLILRLLRLLVPVILGVTVVFLVLLPLRGMSGLFGGLSVAGTLLAMVGAAATLVTSTVDQSDDEAARTPLLTLSARGLCLALPLMAGLGGWAVWLRVAQHGWTPDRIFAAEVALLALGYGVLYALAVLRGAGWMDRVRRANVVMAVALLALSVTSLTPLLNAEAISARNLHTRLTDGRMAVEALEPRVLEDWGLAGAAVLTDLQARAKEPGQEALASQLSGGPTVQDLRAALTSLVPVQPASAAESRDAVLSTLDPFWVKALHAACGNRLPDGGPGCVLLVADLMPSEPGDEAVVIWREDGDRLQFLAFRMMQSGPSQATVLWENGRQPPPDGAAAAIAALQSSPPIPVPAPLNMLPIPGSPGILMLP
jgi:hypothetical protein